MEKKKLLELAKQLNGLVDDDGNALASKKVKVVGISDDKLKASFLDACESIPEEKEGLIPDEISDAYNEIIKDDPREEAKEEKEEEKEETKPTPKKKTETKEKETKSKDKPAASKNATIPSKAKTSAKKEEAKADKKATKSKDEYGHTAGSMAAHINLMLKKGTTKEDMIKTLMEDHGRDERLATGKLMAHIAYLKTNFNVNIETSPKTKKMSIIEGDKK